MRTIAEHRAWWRDQRNRAYQILAIELDYDGGTVRLGSQPWRDDRLFAFDDWMTSDPELEESLEDFLGIGDIDAICADRSLDWGALSFRGYPCRWYVGDTRWTFSEFHQVATATIGGCRKTDGALHRFDLLDPVRLLKRTFVDAEVSISLDARAMVARIAELAGLSPITLRGVDEIAAAFGLTLELGPDTTVLRALQDVARSIGAHVRMTQAGDVEILAPRVSATPRIRLTPDDIVLGGVRQADIVPPYKWVRVEYGDGRVTRRRTPARTGDLAEQIVYPTLIDNAEDALIFVDRVRDYHSVAHARWEIQSLDATDFVSVGDELGVTHEDFVGAGYVNRVKRSPLSLLSAIEVTT